MPRYDTDGSDPEPKRTAASRLLSRYPEVNDSELDCLLRHLKEEASGRDIDIITSDEALRSRHSQLCKDHYIGRLRPMEKVYLTTASIALVLLLAFLSAVARAS